MKTMKINIRQHLSLIIVSSLIIASALSMYYVPTVKSDLSGPYFIRGYIYNASGNVGAGVTVTITNIENDNSGTTITIAGGAYQINVGNATGFDCTNSDQIVVNCSHVPSGSAIEVGENITTIDTGGTFSWCNLSGSTKLVAQSLSFSINDTSWNAGSITLGSYAYTSDTHFNLTNEGNVKINVAVNSSNITWGGGTWYINDTADHDNFTLQYMKEGGAWTAIGYSNSSFVTNLWYNNSLFPGQTWSQLFGLNVTMATSSTVSDPPALSVKVTFWSVIA